MSHEVVGRAIEAVLRSMPRGTLEVYPGTGGHWHADVTIHDGTTLLPNEHVEALGVALDTLMPLPQPPEPAPEPPRLIPQASLIA